MKKTLLILLAFPVLFFTSCSGDDDSAPPIETTSLFGTWDLDYYIQNNDVIENISCNDQITYNFTNTKTYTKTTFAGEGSTRCVVAVIVNGTWENLGDNQFRLTPNGSSSNQNLTITFLDSFRKFSIKYNTNFTEVYAKRN
ncbi:hypothetical protein [Gillisia hiemivivida]|uniref:Lipocalin family protein n=1 Tax=Gillisia hiemivivida TaxID=291190 RepID=A0A5C6ZVA1_9FLAO|nr:hypothetical protein [Gillisia hiemivivida]TXD92783.1 hypothetical protein ES724_12705 [Gillisia hiemivivida]